MMYLYIGLVVSLCILLWFLPALRPTGDTLPILWIAVPGTLPSDRTCSRGLSYKRLEQLFRRLSRKNFTTVLPSQLIKPARTQRSVMLLFDGGYQTIFTHVLPLLEKYNFCAAVALPVGLIGQYDKWNTTGPWQDLLTPEQLQRLHKSGRIEFISEGLDHSCLDALSTEQALWHLQESKARLQHLYHIQAQAFFFVKRIPTQPDVLTAAQSLYPLLIGPKTGNNRRPLSHDPLRLFPVTNTTSFTRLCWKLRRP